MYERDIETLKFKHTTELEHMEMKMSNQFKTKEKIMKELEE